MTTRHAPSGEDTNVHSSAGDQKPTMPEGRWPNGAKAAVAFTIDNMGEAADLDRGLWPASEPIGSHYTVTEVLPQFLALLKTCDVAATYFIESWNLSVYPDAIKSIAEAGHEVAWHAYRHEAWSKLDVETERSNFERSFDDLSGYAAGPGKGLMDKYRGFRPPGGIIHGERTLRLCKQHGLDYISPAGEQAAVVKVGQEGNGIVVLPFKWSTVDAYYYMPAFASLREMKGVLPEEPQSSAVLVSKYQKEIYRAIESGGYVSTLFHPFLTDTPERLQAMEMILQYMVQKRNEGLIWLARCRDVAEWITMHPDTVNNDPKWDETSWR